MKFSRERHEFWAKRILKRGWSFSLMIWLAMCFSDIIIINIRNWRGSGRNDSMITQVPHTFHKRNMNLECEWKWIFGPRCNQYFNVYIRYFLHVPSYNWYLASGSTIGFTQIISGLHLLNCSSGICIISTIDRFRWPMCVAYNSHCRMSVS